LEIVAKGEQLFDVVTRLVPGLEINEQACLTACGEEVHATSEACRLAVEGMPFRDAYAQVARQLQDGTFRPGSATASATMPETVQRALAEITIQLVDSKKWISDRRSSLSIATERLFNWS
jgi:argininosuccinate lyase